MGIALGTLTKKHETLAYFKLILENTYRIHSRRAITLRQGLSQVSPRKERCRGLCISLGSTCFTLHFISVIQRVFFLFINRQKYGMLFIFLNRETVWRTRPLHPLTGQEDKGGAAPSRSDTSQNGFWLSRLSAADCFSKRVPALSPIPSVLHSVTWPVPNPKAESNSPPPRASL